MSRPINLESSHGGRSIFHFASCPVEKSCRVNESKCFALWQFSFGISITTLELFIYFSRLNSNIFWHIYIIFEETLERAHGGTSLFNFASSPTGNPVG